MSISIKQQLLVYFNPTGNWVYVGDCYRILKAKSPRKRNTIRVALCRLVKTGILERLSPRSGMFRLIK